MPPRQRAAKDPKTPRQMVMVQTLPDPDDPRNGLEQQYDAVDDGFSTDGGKPARFFAVVEFEVIGKKLSTKGKAPSISVQAVRVEAPVGTEDQKTVKELLDSLQLERSQREGAQESLLSERPEPGVIRALPSGANADEVLAEPAGLREDG